MGAVVAVLLAAGMFGAWFTTRWAPPSRGARPNPRSAPSSPPPAPTGPSSTSLGMWTLQALAIGVMLAGVQYFATYTFGSASAVTPLFACMIGPLVLFMPLWTRLARARGTRYAQWCASLLYVAGALALACTGVAGRPSDTSRWRWWASRTCGLQLLPLTLLADTLAADAVRTGKRRTATFTGLWTAAETLAFALGAGLFALVLAVTGFRSSDADHEVAQPGAALTGITVGMSLLPAVLAAASLWLLHRYGEETTRPSGVPAERPSAPPTPPPGPLPHRTRI